MIIDSHCHLIHEKNLISVEEIIYNASKNNVKSFLNIATKSEEFDKSIELSEKYKCIYTSIGIHPHEASQMNDDIYNKIIEFSNHEKVIGIGETGLDYFYNNSLKEDQIKSFESHIELSQKTNLPVIIHSRDAEDDIFNIIKKMNDKKPFSAVFHCFTGSTQLLEKLLPFDIYFSISGIVTFKNSDNLRQTVKKIPKDRILPNVKGLKGPFSCLNNARYGISWGAIGSAMACFHSAKTYSLSRIQFGVPIASFQLIQNKLAWMLREITKGQLLAYHLGRKKDDGTWFNEQISLAKMNNVDIALEIARVARDIHGANGILDEYPVMRHMANLESVKTYEGTHDIHNLILGRYITGIQSFTR